MSLTGSGQARPHKGKANGGGTFVHRHANGTGEAHGVYVVTGFNSFVNGDGSFAATGLTDGIGKSEDATDGALSMNVNLMPASGGSLNGVLEVHCSLPGGKPETEGIRLSVASFKFVQDTGATLFHALDD